MKENIAYSLIYSILISGFTTTNVLGVLPLENVPKEYILQDDRPAITTLKGWENDSYPFGNGHFGGSFFGGINKELWQFTEPSVVVYSYQKNKKSHRIEMTSTMDLWMETDHDSKKASDYSRLVDLMRGMGRTAYTLDGVTYVREQLTENLALLW